MKKTLAAIALLVTFSSASVALADAASCSATRCNPRWCHCPIP